MNFKPVLEYFRDVLYILIIFIKSVAGHQLPENVYDRNVEIVSHQHVRILNSKQCWKIFYES